MSRTILIIGLLTLLAWLVAATSAQAAHVDCGQHVRSSITLDGDLLCEGDGLIIAANNVRIDLAGHTIQVRDLSRAIVIEGRRNVTVENGRLDAHEAVPAVVTDSANITFRGIDILGGLPSLLPIVDSRGIRLEGNTFDDVEVVARSVHRMHVLGNAFHGSNTIGLGLIGSAHVVAEGNVFGHAESSSVVVTASSNTVFRENRFEHNHDHGLEIRSGTNNRVHDNHFSDNGFNGLDVRAEALRTHIVGNTATNNGGFGILVMSPSTWLRGNHAEGNGAWGIWAVDGVKDLGGNTASGNAEGDCHNVDCT